MIFFCTKWVTNIIYNKPVDIDKKGKGNIVGGVFINYR